jgi:L-threonylcarbamoyladenylate synthase
MKRKAKIYNFFSLSQKDIDYIARKLKAGAAAILPTDTVYGLLVCALAKNSLQKINKIKNNPSAKLPQVLCTKDMSFSLSSGGKTFEKITKLWPGALTVISKSSSEGAKLLNGAGSIGLRVPADDFILDLISKTGAPFFASSANMHGNPVCCSEEDICEIFGELVDIIVLKGSIKQQSSTIIDLTANPPVILRKGILCAQDAEIYKILL